MECKAADFLFANSPASSAGTAEVTVDIYICLRGRVVKGRRREMEGEESSGESQNQSMMILREQGDQVKEGMNRQN